MIPIWLQITLNIATIIAVLIAPVIQEFVRLRLSQPKPIPDIKKPPNLIQRIGGWTFARAGSPFFFPPILAALNIAVLLGEIWCYPKTKITLSVIAYISIQVGLIVFNLSWMLIMWTRQAFTGSFLTDRNPMLNSPLAWRASCSEKTQMKSRPQFQTDPLPNAVDRRLTELVKPPTRFYFYLIDSKMQKDEQSWRSETIWPVTIEIEIKQKGRLRLPFSF